MLSCSRRVATIRDALRGSMYIRETRVPNSVAPEMLPDLEDHLCRNQEFEGSIHSTVHEPALPVLVDVKRAVHEFGQLASGSLQNPRLQGKGHGCRVRSARRFANGRHRLPLRYSTRRVPVPVRPPLRSARPRRTGRGGACLPSLPSAGYSLTGIGCIPSPAENRR